MFNSLLSCKHLQSEREDGKSWKNSSDFPPLQSRKIYFLFSNSSTWDKIHGRKKSGKAEPSMKTCYLRLLNFSQLHHFSLAVERRVEPFTRWQTTPEPQYFRTGSQHKRLFPPLTTEKRNFYYRSAWFMLWVRNFNAKRSPSRSLCSTSILENQ